MKELTKAEEEIMHVLWKIEKGFIKDIIEELESPKPAYNTVSTIVRILESKGIVGYEAYGKTHRYFPLLSREKYRQFITENLKKSYFNNSPKALLSFFLEEEEINLKQLDELMDLINKYKTKK